MRNNGSFIYDVPTKVYFGPGHLENLGQELARFGKRVLLTYGGGSIKKSGLYQQIVDQVKNAGLELFELGGIAPNPKVGSANAGAAICREQNIDVLLAVGGGSVIDCTKLISGACYYPGDAWDIVTGKVKAEKCLPIVTVLTMTATGSEMNRNAVISNPETKEKLGIKYREMVPQVSFLDPTLTYTVSAYQTACGSADIYSHILETYFMGDDGSMYMLDCFKEGLLKTVRKYAPIALAQPDHYEARANLMWASTWAINSFSGALQNRAWSCHPIEHELSAFYDITHGLGLAILTPRWMEYILCEDTVDKFYQYGVNVFGIDPNLDKMAVAKESIAQTAHFLFDTLGLASTLTQIGIDDTHFGEMAARICKNGVHNGYYPLNTQDVENILRMCL